MNGNYYQNPTFPNAMPINIGEQNNIPITSGSENNYIENILKLNKGKRINAYFSFKNDIKTYSGIMEESGNDYIIISDPQTGNWYLLKTIYLDYIEFVERINYI